MFDADSLALATHLLESFRRRNAMIVTAESCTGGLIAGLLTEIAGSSDVVERGFVTYTNVAKQELLDVPESLLRLRGAVSAEVATAMADGALGNARAEISVAVTGVAGPGGGTMEKPVGLVYIASAGRGLKTVVSEHRFAGDRAGVRRLSVLAAMNLALSQLEFLP